MDGDCMMIGDLVFSKKGVQLSEHHLRDTFRHISLSRCHIRSGRLYSAAPPPRLILRLLVTSTSCSRDGDVSDVPYVCVVWSFAGSSVDVLPHVPHGFAVASLSFYFSRFLLLQYLLFAFGCCFFHTAVSLSFEGSPERERGKMLSSPYAY